MYADVAAERIFFSCYSQSMSCLLPQRLRYAIIDRCVYISIIMVSLDFSS